VLWRRFNAAAPEVWETIAGAALGKSVGTSAYALPGAPDLRGVLGETNVDHTNPATAGHLLKKRPRSGGEPPEPL
jgi:hypothetical protein